MKWLSLAGLALALVTSPVLAQQTTPSAGSNATVPEKVAPPTSLDEQSGSLSSKLSSSKGVIAPSRNTDPGMPVPAPSTGTTPVITPGDKGTAK